MRQSSAWQAPYDRPDSCADVLSLYRDAESYVYGLISGPVSPAAGTPTDEIRRRAQERLDRLRAFLKFIGNPQDQYRTIHVGGTSGKGSTSTLIASVLSEAGYRTGLHVSPYLQVATEKLVLDGRIASAQRYHELVFSLAEQAKVWESQGHERPSYGEFWVALTYKYFAEEAVDIAVIEVGAGGRFDLTNVIQPEVAAITSVGYDHVVTLGPTLRDIAWHKAGILKAGAAGVTSVVDPEALEVIEAEAKALGVPLRRVVDGQTFSDVETSWRGTSFRDHSSSRRFTVSLPGTFQARNASLALETIRTLEDPNINDDVIQRGFERARFPGRMEVVQERPLVLLDGAHNPEKMSGLRDNLPLLGAEQRTILVIGVLETKSFEEMLDQIIKHVDVVIATNPQVIAKPAVDAKALASHVGDRVCASIVEPEPLRAIDRALDLAGPDDVIIVTGSLYLVGNVRERWYPSDKILAFGTMWPE